MELSEILNSLSGGNTEKTASHTHSNETGSSLSQAIDRALSSNFEKEASAGSSSPSGDLLKIAQDISNAETEALIKEAHIYGRAVADGFAARMSEYSGSSTVAQNSHSAQTIKQAMELGYIHASSALEGSEKTASDSYSDPYGGYQTKVAAYTKGQEDAIKVATYLKGQEDAIKVAESLSKIAHNYEEFGFRTGNALLKRL